MSSFIHIAIDGPAGAGKSTLAKNVARTMGILYVDTGALYRAIAYTALSRSVNPEDPSAVIAMLDGLSVTLTHKDGNQIVCVNGSDVTPLIRTAEVSAAASKVSAVPEVRAFLLSAQRTIAQNNACVMDGRDIGTSILPDAEVKIFLTADRDDRAERRFEELKSKGISVDLKTVEDDMGKRDQSDETRKASPLKMADDAILLNNSGFTPEQTLQAAMKIIEEKLHEKV